MLEAARTLPAVRRAVVYEPPLVVDPSYDFGYMRRYDELLANGDVAGALLTGMKGAEMGPPFLHRLPNRLMKPMLLAVLRAEDRKATPRDFTQRAAAPTLSRDFQLVRELAGTQERYREVRAETLLLGGALSPRYLEDALDVLERVLPDARRTVFPKLGHGGSGNADRGGDAPTVAEAMTAFLTS